MPEPSSNSVGLPVAEPARTLTIENRRLQAEVSRRGQQVAEERHVSAQMLNTIQEYAVEIERLRADLEHTRQELHAVRVSRDASYAAEQARSNDVLVETLTTLGLKDADLRVELAHTRQIVGTAEVALAAMRAVQRAISGPDVFPDGSAMWSIPIMVEEELRRAIELVGQALPSRLDAADVKT